MRRRKGLENCRFCGRDTSARDLVCGRCRGGAGCSPSDETKGRKGRLSMQPLSALEDAEEDRDSRSDYHGGSIRDDI